jgi:hypothetical protein
MQRTTENRLRLENGQHENRADQPSTHDLSFRLLNGHIDDSPPPPSYRQGLHEQAHNEQMLARYELALLQSPESAFDRPGQPSLEQRRATWKIEKAQLDKDMTEYLYSSDLASLEKRYNDLVTSSTNHLKESRNNENSQTQQNGHKRAYKERKASIITEVIPKLHALRDEWKSVVNSSVEIDNAADVDEAAILIKELKKAMNAVNKPADDLLARQVKLNADETQLIKEEAQR